MGLLDKLFGPKKEKKESMKIELNEQGMWLDGHSLTFPTSITYLKSILGDASREYWDDNMWRVAWDDLGIYTEYGVMDNVISLSFLQHPQEEVKYRSTGLYQGEIYLNGVSVRGRKDFDGKVGPWDLRALCYGLEGDRPIYSYQLGQNYSHVAPKKDKNKYAVKNNVKDSLTFSDFNFKLAVIDELMYVQEVLEPKVDVYEFADLYKKRNIDIEEEGYDPIPELVAYFKALKIDKKWAEAVSQIYQDGGNEIYMTICPFWDGEDDTFTIESFADIDQFPNLKKMTLFQTEESVLDSLKAKGIETMLL